MISQAKRLRVALCMDYAGQYIHVRNVSIREIEDAGLAFVEDQSIDFKGWTVKDFENSGIIPLSDLNRTSLALFP